jgi:hypothetical protein
VDREPERLAEFNRLHALAAQLPPTAARPVEQRVAELEAEARRWQLAPGVRELNRLARADRVAAGQVVAEGLGLADGSVAGVGDVVVARRNDRHLRLIDGEWVRNRDRFMVTATYEDGSMAVRALGTGGETILPAAYVSEHVELGYATSAWSAQGRTVATAHAIVGVGMTREALYVAATRGKESNRLYVDVEPEPANADMAEAPAGRLGAREVLVAVASLSQASSQARLVLATRTSDDPSASGRRPWKGALANLPNRQCGQLRPGHGLSGRHRRTQLLPTVGGTVLLSSRRAATAGTSPAPASPATTPMSARSDRRRVAPAHDAPARKLPAWRAWCHKRSHRYQVPQATASGRRWSCEPNWSKGGERPRNQIGTGVPSPNLPCLDDMWVNLVEMIAARAITCPN